MRPGEVSWWWLTSSSAGPPPPASLAQAHLSKVRAKYAVTSSALFEKAPELHLALVSPSSLPFGAVPDLPSPGLARWTES